MFSICLICYTGIVNVIISLSPLGFKDPSLIDITTMCPNTLRPLYHLAQPCYTEIQALPGTHIETLPSLGLVSPVLCTTKHVIALLQGTKYFHISLLSTKNKYMDFPTTKQHASAVFIILHGSSGKHKLKRETNESLCIPRMENVGALPTHQYNSQPDEDDPLY